MTQSVISLSGKICMSWSCELKSLYINSSANLSNLHAAIPIASHVTTIIMAYACIATIPFRYVFTSGCYSYLNRAMKLRDIKNSHVIHMALTATSYTVITKLIYLNTISPVPLGGAIHVSSTWVFSVLFEWVTADYRL